jgi:protein-S-isoprenylcysteine O-methyltransferase Ste14
MRNPVLARIHFKAVSVRKESNRGGDTHFFSCHLQQTAPNLMPCNGIIGTGDTDLTLIARATIRSLISEVVIGVLLFASAGSLAWWQGWIYMVVLILSTLLPLFRPFRLDEGLIEERMSRKPGAKQWDKYFVALVGLFTAAELIVPGLDHRWMWTPPQPVWKHLVGVGLIIIGTVGMLWAMKTNRFFSAFVRIQQERGHQVVDGGPYRFVRHPGYAFWSVRTLGVPLLLGSNWALLVAGLFIGMFIIRTMLEDRVLQQELPGYGEYAERVRWKLAKGIW